MFRIFVVKNTTSKLLGSMTEPAPIVVCGWLIASSAIFQPETSTEKGLGLKSSTHSGVVKSAPVFGINSLISTTDELDSAAAGRNSSVNPPTMSSREKIRRKGTGIASFLMAKSYWAVKTPYCS